MPDAFTRWYTWPSRDQRTSSAPGAVSISTAYEWNAPRQPEHFCRGELSPIGSLQGPPSSVPQCMVPKTASRPLTDSITSSSPVAGQPVYPSRTSAPWVQKAGQ